MVISGSFGKVGPNMIGSGAIDVGAAHSTTFSEPALAVHVGTNVNSQVARIDFLPGMNFGPVTVSGRLPILGGAIIDRRTGAGLLATGLKVEAFGPISKVFSVGGSLEGDYLFGAQNLDNGSSPKNGFYMSPSVELLAKVGEHFYIKAQAVAEGLSYKSVSAGNDGSNSETKNETLAFTGMLSAGGGF